MRTSADKLPIECAGSSAEHPADGTTLCQAPTADALIQMPDSQRGCDGSSVRSGNVVVAVAIRLESRSPSVRNTDRLRSEYASIILVHREDSFSCAWRLTSWSLPADVRKYQTLAASPAKPDALPWVARPIARPMRLAYLHICA